MVCCQPLSCAFAGISLYPSRRGPSPSIELSTNRRSWLLSFATYVVAAIPVEEVAWRGFALPHLQKRYSAFVASMIIGVLWAVWHAPLLFNLDNVMSTYPLLPWFVDVMMDSVIYVWLYNSTKGSVLLLVLYHALSNTLGGFAGWSTATASIAIAALLLLIYKPATISVNGRKYSLTD
ncbi:lysostaphin resistance A-like protein [Aerococcus urinaeequi]|uniref:CPBP family intramembrane glutamic endopeptidase n=1 Tax=Aerococcus urinaeequi TaxID=51665 RepID=UPI003D6B474E